ncbi:hypothetical protein WBG99_05485 [Streptomyces sp. TG1A-60]|uniref:hypothetical protein n=1 Tax=Streptomyces sp. TG1A-60 TaxID=3129111 RepID=UPI0030CE25DF
MRTRSASSTSWASSRATYAVTHDELRVGAYGLAVPVRDGDGEVVASLAVIVPTTRTPGFTDHAPTLATRVPCHQGIGTLVRPFLDGLVRQVEQSESLDTPRLGHNVADLIGTLLTEYMGVDRAPGDEGRDLLVFGGVK